MGPQIELNLCQNRFSAPVQVYTAGIIKPFIQQWTTKSNMLVGNLCTKYH